MNFSQRLKELRTSLGISQRELARAIKLSSGMISMYEAGKKIPTIDVLNRLADFFGVSADYLIGRSDDPKPVDGELPEFVKEQLSKIKRIKEEKLSAKLRYLADELYELAKKVEEFE
ncbi:XRE family transcriptional regulator [Archaeoglobales archaeon]|nr:MAG: XRE family transcriptional regulator [Archaeoglobales archaeon]